MSELKPMMLLVVLLLGLGVFVAYLLGVYVAVKLAGRRGRSPLRWGLIAGVGGLLGPGTLLLAQGYLARVNRRSLWLWLGAELLAFALAGALLREGLLRWGGVNLMLDVGMLLGGLAVVFVPLVALSLAGPGRVQDKPSGDGLLIQAQALSRTYRMGKVELKVLRSVDLSVRRGEFLAILGASGSGKSTLLHLLGLLDRPDQGRLIFDGADAAELAPQARDRCRSRDIGFVFQFYHLLPEFSAVENTLLPVMTSVGLLKWLAVRGQARRRATELLTQLGLGERLRHRPMQLSGGEQQRVAIARAMINQPKVLLADEPTGNLDSKTGLEIIKVLRQLNQANGQTIVMVTHDQSLAQLADRVVHLRDGKL
jgi:lipoprotein-releasing system ATP-binding protein